MIPELRCKRCNKKLGENFEGKLSFVCPRCQTYNKVEERDDEQTRPHRTLQAREGQVLPKV